MPDDVEWDENKRLANLKDHAVDFRLAAKIFEGGFHETEDLREDYGEQRWRALGSVDGDYYFVAYTWRRKRRRLISAWRVGENGRRRYQAILDG